MTLRLAINTQTNELIGISQDCEEVSLNPDLFKGVAGPAGPVGPEGPQGPAGESGQAGQEEEIAALRSCINSLVTQLQERLDQSPWITCDEPLNIDCEN